MRTLKESIVADNAELSPGDQIHVWQKGRLLHSGTAKDTTPAMNLFWVQQEGYGGRRLLDMNEFTVTRPEQAR